MSHLLIVEDDALLRNALRDQLALAGYRTTVADNGAHALDLLEQQAFDGIVLDLGLPQVDGISVLKSARQRHGAIPVMILTARDGVDDRVQGLEAGADDYLSKPFEMKELQARVAALLRRARQPAFGGSMEVAAGRGRALRVDPQQPLAWLGEQALDITQREWSLLLLLLAHKDQVVSREEVMAVWQNDQTPDASSTTASNSLEVYIHRLRRKLADSDIQIRNVRGLGYILQPADPS